MAKWMRFDRCHRGDFTLQCHRPYASYRLQRRLLRTHTTGKIRRILLKTLPIKGPVPTPNMIVQHSFRLAFRKRRMVSSLLLFISCA